jgi:biotin synthase
MGATRACLVASGRGPSERDLNAFCQSVEDLKLQYPHLEVCACLGLLEKDQAGRLKKAGVNAYNHNLNTSQRHYEKICGTHTYKDRVETVENSQSCGLSSCSGILAGMGETNEDLVVIAFSLRKLAVDSIPVNFLIAIPKTPLEGTNQLTPQRCLKILALFRLTNPTAEVRIAGGREVHLRSLQPLGLMIANSIFLGDYLTTKGQSPTMDLEMIRDMGYTIQGQSDDFLSTILRQPSPSAELVTSC